MPSAQESLTSRNAALEDFLLRQQTEQRVRRAIAGETDGDNQAWLDRAHRPALYCDHRLPQSMSDPCSSHVMSCHDHDFLGSDTSSTRLCVPLHQPNPKADA